MNLDKLSYLLFFHPELQLLHNNICSVLINIFYLIKKCKVSPIEFESKMELFLGVTMAHEIFLLLFSFSSFKSLFKILKGIVSFL